VGDSISTISNFTSSAWDANEARSKKDIDVTTRRMIFIANSLSCDRIQVTNASAWVEEADRGTQDGTRHRTRHPDRTEFD
jgi:hypothetical protein